MWHWLKTLANRWDRNSARRGRVAKSRGLRCEPLEQRQLLAGFSGLDDGASFPYHNPVNPFDVSGDGALDPIDLLMVGGAPQGPVPATGSGPPYFDVVPDNAVTPDDAQVVHDMLNAMVGGGPVAGVQVRIWPVATNLQGTPISNIAVGEDFLLHLYVQDVRDEALGMLAAYLDVNYDPGLLTTTAEDVSDLSFNPDYNAARSGGFGMPGTVDDVGAWATAVRSEVGEELLFSIRMTAAQPGVASFTTDPADDEGRETLVYGQPLPLPPVVITFDSTTLEIIENEPGVTVSAISGDTSEDGQSATFTVVLDSPPAGLVQVLLTCSDPTEGLVSPISLDFTADDWNVPQIVTVTGVDDDLDDGDVEYLIEITVRSDADPRYDGLPPFDLGLVNLDDDRDNLPWQNQIHHCDINNDGWITPEDLLILITEINARGARDLPLPPAPPEMPPPFLDASGDDAMSAADLLVVIEHLNAHGSGPAVSGGADSSGGSSPAGPEVPAGEGEAAMDLVSSAIIYAGAMGRDPAEVSMARSRIQGLSPLADGTESTGSGREPLASSSFRAPVRTYCSERDVDLLISEPDQGFHRSVSTGLEATLSIIADEIGRSSADL